ncbi:hypothetical protein BH10PSE12_BH10PSE12_05520 [soil metagenome]
MAQPVVQLSAPAEIRGRVLGLFNMAALGCRALAGITVGTCSGGGFVPSRLPLERLHRAITSGFRYIVHSPSIRIVLWRTLATGLAGGSVSALMPLVARDLLGWAAETYVLLLGKFGIGAVLGALNINKVRERLSAEQAVSLCAVLMAPAMVAEAKSPWHALTALVFIFAGAA